MSRRGDMDGPVFDEPWQAQAFAMAVALQEAGMITLAEWSHALGRERGRADLAVDGDDYYLSVVAALEAILETRDVASRALISELSGAWARAAKATPHGMPIALENDPLRDAEERGTPR